MDSNSKIFISYSEKDYKTADSLYEDLTARNVKVFKFKESATPGKPIWGEVTENIVNADIFILLASKDSLKSKFVEEEIEIAHYNKLNHAKPSTLLPLILKPKLLLPKQIRHYNGISFIDYDQGFIELVRFLQLDNSKSTESKPSVNKKEIVSPQKIHNNKSFNALSNLLVKTKYLLSLALIVMLGFFLIWLYKDKFLEILGYLSKNYGQLNSWSIKWPWVSRLSKAILLIFIAITSFHNIKEEFPINVKDYLTCGLFSLFIAISTSFIWNIFFLVDITAYATVMYLALGVATLAILFYMIVYDRFF